MKEWDLLEAMTAVDDRYLAEAEAAPASPARRKPWLRPALIAACLCLALGGTVLAVEAVRALRVTEKISGGYVDEYGVEYNYTSVETTADSAYIPLDQLSDNVWELIGQEEWSMPVLAGFDSWSEAEAFLELELADNPVLENMMKQEQTLRYELGRGKEATGNCILTLQGSLKAPTFIELDAAYYVDPEGTYDAEKTTTHLMNGEEIEELPMRYTRVMVKADISTEAAYQNPNGRGRGFASHAKDILTEEYTTENGLEAIIFDMQPDRENSSYVGCCVLNGAYFTIWCTNSLDGQLALSTLKEVLEGFS